MRPQPVEVLFNRAEVPNVWRIGLAWDAFAAGARAARFLMLAHPDRRLHLLPRPFSISDVRREASGRVVTEILYKPIGRYTEIMSRMAAGDTLELLGLLGNGFPDPQPGRRPVLIAGGIGNAPFAYQARELAAGALKDDPSRAVLLLAGRSAEDLWIQPIVRELGVEVVEITEDGSAGEQGRVTDALLKRLPELGPIEGFACGPEPMLRAVQAMALEHDFPCHLSVEERMACGYGVCNACVVEERSEGTPRGEGRYIRSCIEGPVFECRTIHA